MRRTTARLVWSDACLVPGRGEPYRDRFQKSQAPYYIKPAHGNPWIGLEYDGKGLDYGTGYVWKKMPFLSRFRHNISLAGECPLYLRHPSRHKYVHWMYVSRMGKFWQEHGELEPWNMLLIGWIIIIYTVWHCYRYFLYHPHHSTYALTSMPTKNSIQMRRHEQYHPMDKPVFRYYQSTPDFYWYSPMRDMINLDMIANCPYIELLKSKGVLHFAQAYPMGMVGHGDSAVQPKRMVGGKYTHGRLIPEYLPYQWREGGINATGEHPYEYRFPLPSEAEKGFGHATAPRMHGKWPWFL